MVDFKKALKTLSETIPLLGQVIFGTTIIAVIVGVLLQQVTSGNISVIAAIGTFLNGSWITSVVAFFTTFSTAITVTLGLLIVVVIVVLFGKYMSGKSSKGDKM